MTKNIGPRQGEGTAQRETATIYGPGGSGERGRPQTAESRMLVVRSQFLPRTLNFQAAAWIASIALRAQVVRWATGICVRRIGQRSVLADSYESSV
jgi:hypothetical protein